MQCPAKKFQLCYSITKQNALLVNCSSGWNTHVWTLLSLFWSFDIFNQCLFSYCIALYLACENIPFSSLFAAGEVSLPSGKERGKTDVFAGYMLLKNDSLLRILRFPGYFETPLFRTFFPFPLGLRNSGVRLYSQLHHHPFMGLLQTNSTICSQLAC